MDLESVKKNRRPFRAQITKMKTSLDAMCTGANVDHKALKLNLSLFEDINKKMVELDTLALEKAVEEGKTDAEVDAEMQTIIDYKQKVAETREGVYSILTATGASSSTFQDPGASQRNFKLPKIQMKTFNGDLKEWLGFWSQFQKIHDDKNLHASDKFQYLMQAMAENTEAREIVLSYPLTEDNYPKAVESLKKRYGDNDLLLQVYVREMLNLVISNVTAKEKVPLARMYLQLESHLRSLKSLNLEKADPATWLYPLVESSLTEEVLLAWQRSPQSTKDGTKENPPKTRLDYLMEFLEGEVQIKQKISLAQSSFQMHSEPKREAGMKKGKGFNQDKVPTLAGLHVGESTSSCVFCGRRHESKECFSAQTMTMEEKMSKLKEGKCCFKCCSPHYSKFCKAKVRCVVCLKQHVPVMCPVIHERKGEVMNKPVKEPEDKIEVSAGFVNHMCTGQVILNTLTVQAIGRDTKRTVRVLVDNGSQRSYITKRLARELSLEKTGEESVIHSLFRGSQTAVIPHSRYLVKLQPCGGGAPCQISVRDDEKLCGGIPRIPKTANSKILNELKQKRIWISDVGDTAPPIEIIIGADVFGKLLTGKIIQLDCGLTAFETKLGWTVQGEVETGTSRATEEINLAATDASIADLWSLETIGIRDPVEVKSTADQDAEAKEEFLKSLSRKEDGRYVVKLPWAKGHPPLPRNYEVAVKRLNSTTRKLLSSNNFDNYSSIFSQWEQEGIIELVLHQKAGVKVHYVPHRPVFKAESLTTPVRPVFDGSCKTGNAPSLNDCLETGPSYIQMIPEILLRFREKRIGVTSDIRKAFQMIEVQEEDRDAMRFLWWENYANGTLKEYRHTRVMFGATCSPFILGAVLEYHLTHVKEDDKEIANTLLQSLFVDNCVTSVETIEEMETFKEAATRIMDEAKMELRMWMCSDKSLDPAAAITTVLGLKWDRKRDTLAIMAKSNQPSMTVTKRNILSVVHKVYDPIGFTVPAVIPMKMMLQEAWINKASWDQVLPETYATKLEKWIDDGKCLAELEIPRNFNGNQVDRSDWSLHTCTDASSGAFACVSYLRVDHGSSVTVQLLGASSRVAPLSRVTIPRLELLGCVIGSRLADNIKRALRLENIPEYYWTDSSTALAWIRRNDNWATWVGNRVTGINKLTNSSDWRHVPGAINPADLPSRGCSPRELINSKWWEGPGWMNKSEEVWPNMEVNPDESLVKVEMKKSVGVEISMLTLNTTAYTGTFHRLIRVYGWVLRFIKNSKDRKRTSMKLLKKREALSDEEKAVAEKKIMRIIQEEAFPTGNVEGFQLHRDEDGLLRVKTRIIMRKDKFNFRYPVLLPRKHPFVTKLIQDVHVRNCHVGINTLMTMLREKFWIIRSRDTIRRVLGQCPRCRRFSAQNINTAVAPLPADRINDAEVFEIIGVDLAGPMFLRNGKKIWICIFTCAVYRAVHFEVVQSVSTRSFLLALRKFVKIYGRPRVIYSDNGTNFVGSNNLFKKLDWGKIQKEEDVVPIHWKFNPPTAAWWGGFWERLIRSLKDLMKRMIGKATLSLEEFEVVVGSVKEIMNQRPLTYVSENPDEPAPLTPAMFLRPNKLVKFPEGQLLEGEKLRCRWNYLQTLKEELRQRFRREYLGLQIAKVGVKEPRTLKIGEVVLIGSDSKKRMDWPLGRVMELIPSRSDQVERTAVLKTQNGYVTRPVQRLFPLELDWNEEEKEETEAKRTRYGRKVKVPDRLGYN